MAKKIENLLLRKISAAGGFCLKIISAEFCAFFGCFLIVALSVLVQSTRDLGHDSAAYIEITQKMLRGGKYYHDFFENNLPLPFLITAIPVLAANFSNISPIIALQIFVNLVGIISIFFSYKIIERSELARDRAILNLVILGFCCGFFLRVFTLQFNELGTKTTYFLALVFPYISYHFLAPSRLKKIDQILLGVIAALIFCLKPQYGILVIVFEVGKLGIIRCNTNGPSHEEERPSLASHPIFMTGYIQIVLKWITTKNKSLKPLLCLRNYITFSLLISYLLLLFICFPDYIEAIPSFSQFYFKAKYIAAPLFVKEDIFPIFLMVFLCRFLFAENNFLRPLFLAILASGLIIAAEIINDYDQRVIFYSLSLAFLFSAIFLLIKDDYINWKRDGVLLLSILILPQFAQKEFFAIALDSVAFWWVFVLVLSKKWRKILGKNQQVSNIFLNEFFLPRSVVSWFYFSLLFLFWLIVTLSEKHQISWSVSAIIFILMLNFYQKLQAKFLLEKKISTLSACSLFLVLSYVIGLHLASISDSFNFNSKSFKSPNYVNDQMAKIIKSYAAEDEQIVVIASAIYGAYPMMNYLKKENPLPLLQFLFLYEIIKDGREFSSAQSYLFSRLKQQLSDQKTKLIFIERKRTHQDNDCWISFLERYFYDQEFKKIFLKNYVFLNHIIEEIPAEKKVSFFEEEKESNLPQRAKILERDVEVYIRK